MSAFGTKRTFFGGAPMSAFDAVDGASSTVSKCYSSCVENESNQGGETTANLGAEALNELARTTRRNADKVDPGIGRTRLGQRIFECVLLIGTRSAQSIMASGFTAAQTGRTHDRTRPMLQQLGKFLPRRRRHTLPFGRLCPLRAILHETAQLHRTPGWRGGCLAGARAAGAYAAHWLSQRPVPARGGAVACRGSPRPGGGGLRRKSECRDRISVL